jgi:hypothetical protein
MVNHRTAVPAVYHLPFLPILLGILHLVTTGPVLSLIDHETSFGNWYCPFPALVSSDSVCSIYQRPSSRVLFNIVADMLAALIARAKEDGEGGDIIPRFIE